MTILPKGVAIGGSVSDPLELAAGREPGLTINLRFLPVDRENGQKE
ncbi:MAG TPA: hypothetical protein VFV58_18080 [Blastocatellia bacterium]|nr:hypothetical protein [Blastocatellia bacterium]